ncbi:MAG TPA: hypothetical protein VMM36_10105 [Opitutaceae bacterium]|nr:hypothetical protein [Opitutaceae bacterium]
MTIPTPSLRIAAFLVFSLLLGGCETFEERVRTTREVPVITHEFDATAATVMTAAPDALLRMGYSITSTSAAHGRIEAITNVRRDAGMRNSRQTRLKFAVEERDGGYSLASMQAWEIREEENTRGERLMSEIGVVNSSFHLSIFSAIEEVIAETAK